MSHPEFDNSGFHNSKVILVLGPTGTGKTSFIQHLRPYDIRDDSLIGSGLESKTTDIFPYPVDIAGEKVVLVDTPGLDIGSGDVFEEVARWLARKDRIGSRSVYGILLFHSMRNNRIPNCMTTFSLTKGLRKVLPVSIDDSYPFVRITIVTTHWVMVVPELSEDGERDTEQINSDQLNTETLLLNTWALLEKQGMTIQRYLYNSQKCAKAALLSVLNAEPPDTKIISARDRLIVAVIGVTGSGKSTLIGNLTGDYSSVDETFPIEGVSEHEVQLGGENVILLDTPGLDRRIDREVVFKLISNWLKKQAKLIRRPRLYLDGIILVHPPLVEGKPTEMISQMFLINQINILLGKLKWMRDKKDENAYRRLILATSMWNKCGPDSAVMEEREEIIKHRFWNIMLAAGSRVVRFDNTPGSARRIVELIVEEKKSRDPVYQYRSIMEEINDIKTQIRSVHMEITAVREDQALLRGHQEALARVPEWDKIVASATLSRN